jgi:uncharacterized RDD family membrane protein YckC
MKMKQAKTGTRFLILLIDTLAYTFLVVLFFMVLSRFSVMFQSYNVKLNRIVAFSFYFSYYFFLELFTLKTIGKIITKTRVNNERNSSKPSVFQFFIRSLCRFIPLDLFTIFFSGKNLTWHDKISGTSVIYDH